MAKAEAQDEIHRSIVDCSYKFCSGAVTSPNARCSLFLLSLCHFISDYRVPPKKELYRDLPSKLQLQYNFITENEPPTPGLENSFRYVKQTLMVRIPGRADEQKAKKWLVQKILDYLQFSLVYASQLIGQRGSKLINDGDTIMVYASSQSIFNAIVGAKKQGKKFDLVIIDSRPYLTGREALTSYTAAGIDCQYILLQSMSFHMKQASKLFMGAVAMKSNGSLVSNIGSATAACIANYYKLPCIVFCETYKFVEKCQLDAICANQFGNPEQLANAELYEEQRKPESEAWRGARNLKLLNLKYDLTPTKYISQVVCELGGIPPSSIPVLIREYVQNSEVEYTE